MVHRSVLACVAMALSGCTAAPGPAAQAEYAIVAPDRVIAENLDPPAPPPFDPSRLRALEPLPPGPLAVGPLAASPLALRALAVAEAEATDAPASAVQTPVAQRLSRSVTLVPAPAILLPVNPIRPILLERLTLAAGPFTWGSACRAGDRSACIMAQAVGPDRGP